MRQGRGARRVVLRSREIDLDDRYRMHLYELLDAGSHPLPRIGGMAMQVVSGTVVLSSAVAGRTCVAREGDFLLLSADDQGEPWQVAAARGETVRLVVLTAGPGGFSAPRGDDNRRDGLYLTSHGFPSLGAQIWASPTEGEAHQLYMRAKGLELTAMILASLHQKATQPALRSASQRVQDVTRLLDEALASPPPVQTLARQFGTTAARLTGDFKAVHGMTIHRYVQERRLNEAFRLLSQDGVHAAVAAYRVGYSPAHFSTLFRQRYGICPRDLTARGR